MEEKLISFDTAKLAKEKGFEALCRFSYDSDKGLQVNEPLNKGDKCFLNKCDVCCSAPTQSLLQRWLREVHNSIIEVLFVKEDGVNKLSYESTVDYYKPDFSNLSEDSDFISETYDTYEQALEVGLLEALKLIK